MQFDDMTKMMQIDQDDMYAKIVSFPDQINRGWSMVLKQNNFNLSNFAQIYIGGYKNIKTIISLLKLLIGNQWQININALPQLPNKVQYEKENLYIIFINNENFLEMDHFIKSKPGSECTFCLLVNDQKYLDYFEKIAEKIWFIENHKSDRTSIGFDTFILYGLLHKSGLIPDLSDDINDLVRDLQNTVSHLAREIPSMLNPAKRLAGQMVGRWVKIVADGIMIPVAHRWSDQINQNSKALSSAEDLSHLLNHSITGIINPMVLAQQSLVVFLKSSFNDIERESRLDCAKEELMCNGIGTDFYSARGSNQQSQVWTTILFGDFLSYYLAIAYDCDPTPTISLDQNV